MSMRITLLGIAVFIALFGFFIFDISGPMRLGLLQDALGVAFASVGNVFVIQWWVHRKIREGHS